MYYFAHNIFRWYNGVTGKTHAFRINGDIYYFSDNSENYDNYDFDDNSDNRDNDRDAITTNVIQD